MQPVPGLLGRQGPPPAPPCLTPETRSPQTAGEVLVKVDGSIACSRDVGDPLPQPIISAEGCLPPATTPPWGKMVLLPVLYNPYPRTSSRSLTDHFLWSFKYKCTSAEIFLKLYVKFNV